MTLIPGRTVGGALVACFLLACAKPTVLPPPPPPPVLDYVVEVGDTLGIRVLGESSFDDRLKVGPDGRIAVAPIGSVEAAGKTVSQLDAILRERLARYVRKPHVTVFVREFANINVYVGGEVKRPGLIPLRSGMTSLMALFAAGGFRDTAQKEQVIVLRNAAAGRERIWTLDAPQVLAGRVADVTLEPYDVIFVPKSTIARVNLAVEQYIKRMLPFSLFANAGYAFVPNQPAVITTVPTSSK
jgi:polysaccharide biosynthesis/export protein